MENGDGTLGVDMNKVNTIRRQWGGKDYDGRLLKLGPEKNTDQNTTSFLSADNIIGVGGHTTGRLVRNPDTGEITGEMFDPWDIQPF